MGISNTSQGLPICHEGIWLFHVSDFGEVVCSVEWQGAESCLWWAGGRGRRVWRPEPGPLLGRILETPLPQGTWNSVIQFCLKLFLFFFSMDVVLTDMLYQLKQCPSISSFYTLFSHNSLFPDNPSGCLCRLHCRTSLSLKRNIKVLMRRSRTSSSCMSSTRETWMPSQSRLCAAPKRMSPGSAASSRRP